ncbi:P-loop containing nucleoside triphosphate hydrolase protein, partial [Cladochytrium replicatum]
YATTIFAFGQTGSGKTFTITGPEKEIHPMDSGIIPRALKFLFENLPKGGNVKKVSVKVAYLEIYNEQVHDLLNSTSNALSVRWTAERGFYVENLLVIECESLDDCISILEEGLRNRTTRSHKMNEYSSRSHSIMTVYLETELVENEETVVTQGKLSFVDLAGSEKVKESMTSGEVFAEALNINKSLLTLGNCISALSDARKRGGHVPYRDSKLTKLLADSLGGTGMALMFACVAPSVANIHETLKTLRYANRAKHIRNR